MKKTAVLLLVASMILFAFGCKKQETTNVYTDTASTDTSGTVTETTSTTMMSTTDTTMTSTSGTSTTATSGTTSTTSTY